MRLLSNAPTFQYGRAYDALLDEDTHSAVLPEKYNRCIVLLGFPAHIAIIADHFLLKFKTDFLGFNGLLWIVVYNIILLRFYLELHLN